MLIEEILKGENEKIEFKENAKTNAYIKTAVAFANGNGGKIVFGVKDNGEIIGVENEFEVMDGIINVISDSCYPMIVPDISLHTLENKTVVIMEIEGGKKKPYYLKSKGMQKGTYIRSGATTRIIEEDYILKELVLEGENKYFDQQICYGESVNDEEIERFCEWLEELARENSETDTKIKKVTKNTLLSWKLLEEKMAEFFRQMPIFYYLARKIGKFCERYNVVCLKEKLEAYLLIKRNLKAQLLCNWKKRINMCLKK